MPTRQTKLRQGGRTLVELTQSRTERLVLRRAHKRELTERFGVADSVPFGSAVRDQAVPTSDISFLGSFNGPADSKHHFGV